RRAREQRIRRGCPPGRAVCSRRGRAPPRARGVGTRSPGAGRMNREQRMYAERWLSWVRLGAVPFAILQAILAEPYPASEGNWIWLTTAIFAIGSAVLFYLARLDLSDATLGRLGLIALIFDFAVISSFILALHYEATTPIRQVMILVLIEGA